MSNYKTQKLDCGHTIVVQRNMNGEWPEEVVCPPCADKAEPKPEKECDSLKDLQKLI